MKLISGKTTELIEKKFRNYNKIQAEITEWRQDVLMSGGEQKENMPNAGYISDPTANKAMRLENPPAHIKEAMLWIDVIDKTIKYAKEHNSYKVYFIWYGRVNAGFKQPKTLTSAYTRVGMTERTFRIKRHNIINYAGVKALEKGLIKKLYENF